jgi:protein-S-isoprenylcysteine O-methyltransferase Ste14
MTGWPRIARRIRVPLGFGVAMIYLWLARPTRQSMAWGAVAVIGGLVVRALASGHVRKNEALATSGPYAYTRNPLYLGSLLIGSGFAVAARSWWIGILLVAMFFAIYLPVIRGEERFLQDKFPGFREYSQRVPRLFPKAIPRANDTTMNDAHGFSWDLYRQHREYNALLGALAITAALIVKMVMFQP